MLNSYDCDLAPMIIVYTDAREILEMVVLEFQHRLVQKSVFLQLYATSVAHYYTPLSESQSLVPFSS